jgi:hypothetical protein
MTLNEELVISGTALSNLGEGLDLHQEIRVGQLRDGDRRTPRRGRAEVAPAQIGVFVKLRELCDIADRKNNVFDRRTTSIERFRRVA